MDFESRVKCKTLRYYVHDAIMIISGCHIIQKDAHGLQGYSLLRGPPPSHIAMACDYEAG